MAGGKTKINGTNYDIVGGRCLVGGTGYSIKKGIVRVDGTIYRIYLGTTANVRVQLMNKRNTACYVTIYLNDLYYGRVNGGEFEARWAQVKANIGDRIRVEPYLISFLDYDGLTNVTISPLDVFEGTVSQKDGVEINYVMED